MKCLAVSLLLFLGGCSTSSFYPVVGATTGAAGGAAGGGVPGAAVGAGIGWGVGKGAQVVKENKNLKEEVEAYSKGDVEKLVQLRLEEARETGFFDGVVDQVWSFLKICIFIIIVVQVLPFVFTYLSNKKTRKQLEENGISKKVS